jgi:hypothetical protein
MVRRLVVAALGLLLLAVLVPALPAAPAPAQTPPSISTTTVPDLSNCVNSEPLPTCGRKPQHSGDLGGSSQLILFGLLVGASILIGFVIARSTIRVTRARKAQLG